MRYKALILDLDGTTVPNQRDGVPSERVATAIRDVSSLLKVGVATGRPLQLARPILDKITCTGPCILNNGVQIYDPHTGKVLKQFALPDQSLQRVLDVIADQGVKLFINTAQKMDIPYTGQEIEGTVLSVFMTGLEKSNAKSVIDAIGHINGITTHMISSWEKEKVDVEISHVDASKQHGVVEVCRILDISPQEIIAIGDSYNDFPLLMASGLKIAMGNAVDEVKAIADFIAPSVDNDGVAVVIEKLILDMQDR